MRGDPTGMHTQIIGYNAGSNSDADVYIRFEAAENHQKPVFPSITVLNEPKQ
jgi:hypothetical protein